MNIFQNAPCRALALLLLLAWSGASPGVAASKRESWIEVRSPHFVAYSDAGEAAARRTLEGFEGIRSVFGAVLPGINVDLHKPVVVIVAENEATMRRFVPDQFAGKDPKRSSGMYMRGRERDLAIVRLDAGHQEDQPFAVVFHEYTHAIVHNNFAGLPTWLDEGIAEFYGSTEIRSKRVYLGRIPFHHLENLRRGRMPLTALLQVNHDSPEYMEGSKANQFYAQSWAMVHYLFMDEEARKGDAFTAYLRALSRQPDPLAAAQEGFGDLAKFEGRIAQYVSRPSLTFFDMALQVTLSDKDFRVRPVSEAEALVIRAEILAQSRKEEEAGLLLDQARVLDARSPHVQAALGLTALRKGDWPGAERALRGAQAAGSTDFRVPLHLAELALQGVLDPPASPEVMLGWLEEARRLEPDYPGIHLALSRFHARDPREAEKAIQAGRAAIKLAPSDITLRLNFGSVLMALGREAEAKDIGDQIARMAHEAWERQASVSYQAQLARFMEYRAALAKAAEVPSPAPSEPSPSTARTKPGVKPLKFWLPDSLAGLQKEVHAAVMQGRLDEAIQMVQAAISKAKGPYEKPSLKALLEHLKGRKAGY
jgi:tetratricopeptide (TPR) repeat protein